MMTFFSHMALVLALTGYAVSSGLFLHAFPKAQKRARIRNAAFWLFCVSTVMTLLALGLSISGPYYSQTSGLVLISAVAFITILADLKFQIKLMGIFVSPFITLVLVYLAFSYPKGAHINPPPTGILTSHIAIAVLGQAFAITAFAISLLYLFQQRALKLKQLNFITGATPPLHKLERFTMISLWAGFFLLTLGLITGAIYTGFFVSNTMAGLSVKISWALLVWLWYLAILLAKNVFNQSGSVIAKMSVGGFLLLLLFFFGLYQWGGVF